MTKERIRRFLDLMYEAGVGNGLPTTEKRCEYERLVDEFEKWEHDDLCDYLAQLYWIAVTTGDWDAKWAVMVSLWGVG